MEPELRFERIEALLHAMAERGNQMEIRFNRRMDRADERTEKFDRRLEATRKIVEVGMKLMVRLEQGQRESRALFDELAQSHKDLSKSHKELAKSQKAFIDSLRRGGNGNGRKNG
jgi:dsDNA-binding SOS-regulon protein